MNDKELFLLSLSVMVPAVAGAIRFRTIAREDHPFLYFIWLGLFTELLTYFVITKTGSNTLIANCYVLVESLVLILQFRRWGLWTATRYKYPALLALLPLVWIGTSFIVKPWENINSYYRVFYSIVVVLSAVEVLNRLVFSERNKSAYRYRFLICSAFVILYAYNILVESFYIYPLSVSPQFSRSLFDIKAWCNFFINLVYAIAIIWIPQKKTFTFR